MVVSFKLEGDGRARIYRIYDDGRGWENVCEGKLFRNDVWLAITNFTIQDHPYIFVLKEGNTACISRINDDGNGWTVIYQGKWSSGYDSVVSFQLEGHPYLLSLKRNNKVHISRIHDDGRGWDDIFEGVWSRNYVGATMTVFYLDGRPHMFVLRGAPHNQGWIMRLHEPHTIAMDLSDHYPVKITFGVQRQ